MARAVPSVTEPGLNQNPSPQSPLPQASGRLWRDLNANGMQDAGERVFVERLRSIPNGRWSHRFYSEGAKPGDKNIYTLQVNITKLCNQVCRHCHVDASPSRREMMSAEGIAKCLDILERHFGESPTKSA